MFYRRVSIYNDREKLFRVKCGLSIFKQIKQPYLTTEPISSANIHVKFLEKKLKYTFLK